MATAPQVSEATQAGKKPGVLANQVRLFERVKSQLNAAVLRGGKITVEELKDLELHVKKITTLLE